MEVQGKECQQKNRLGGALGRVCALVLAVGVVLGGMPAAWAYSYAAAGKEPLIDAREAALTAIGKGDWAAAKAAISEAQAEVSYLVEHHFPTLRRDLDEALASENEKMVRLALRDAFVAEIVRRLGGAHQNLNDYQAAKVLVVKARRFLDAIAADLKPTVRTAAEQSLDEALNAIGNPGVFGMGAKKADQQAFAEAEKKTRAILAR